MSNVVTRVKNKAENMAKDRKLKQHPKAASDARSMKYVVEWIQKYTDIKPKVICEIGANYGQDAEGLRHYLDLEPKDVWVFEAHPDIHAEILKMYSFRAFNVAVFNKTQMMTFNVVDINTTDNSGISSLYQHSNPNVKTKEITVPSIRMDDFMKEHNLSEIDVLKLDVEGCNYEVLEGFGKRLKDVKVMHIEAEHIPVWKGQKLYADIARILEENGFELAMFERHYSQSDEVWVQKRFFKSDVGDE